MGPAWGTGHLGATPAIYRDGADPDARGDGTLHLHHRGGGVTDADRALVPVVVCYAWALLRAGARSYEYVQGSEAATRRSIDTSCLAVYLTSLRT